MVNIQEQNLNNEEFYSEQPEVEDRMGYTKLFDHFDFTKEERQNEELVKKVQYIWGGLLILSKKENQTPMDRLAEIERQREYFGQEHCLFDQSY